MESRSWTKSNNLSVNNLKENTMTTSQIRPLKYALQTCKIIYKHFKFKFINMKVIRFVLKKKKTRIWGGGGRGVEAMSIEITRYIR